MAARQVIAFRFGARCPGFIASPFTSSRMDLRHSASQRPGVYDRRGQSARDCAAVSGPAHRPTGEARPPRMTCHHRRSGDAAAGPDRRGGQRHRHNRSGNVQSLPEDTGERPKFLTGLASHGGVMVLMPSLQAAAAGRRIAKIGVKRLRLAVRESMATTDTGQAGATRCSSRH